MFGNQQKQNEIKMTWEQVRAESVRIKAKEEAVAKTKAEYEAKLEEVEEKDRQLQEQENQLKQAASEIAEKSAKLKEVLHKWEGIKEKTEAEQQQLTEEITRKQKELERLKSDILRAEIDLKSDKERAERELSQIISQQTAVKQQYTAWKAKAEKDFILGAGRVVELGQNEQGGFLIYEAEGKRVRKKVDNSNNLKIGDIVIFKEYPSGETNLAGLFVPLKKAIKKTEEPTDSKDNDEQKTAPPVNKAVEERQNIKVE